MVLGSGSPIGTVPTIGTVSSLKRHVVVTSVASAGPYTFRSVILPSNARFHVATMFGSTASVPVVIMRSVSGAGTAPLSTRDSTSSARYELAAPAIVICSRSSSEKNCAGASGRSPIASTRVAPEHNGTNSSAMNTSAPGRDTLRRRRSSGVMPYVSMSEQIAFTAEACSISTTLGTPVEPEVATR